MHTKQKNNAFAMLCHNIFCQPKLPLPPSVARDLQLSTSCHQQLYQFTQNLPLDGTQKH
jgi:hypothetical protein